MLTVKHMRNVSRLMQQTADAGKYRMYPVRFTVDKDHAPRGKDHCIRCAFLAGRQSAFRSIARWVRGKEICPAGISEQGCESGLGFGHFLSALCVAGEAARRARKP